MTANLLLADAMEPGEVIRPPCWNRPPVQSVSVRHGIDSATGAAISVTLRNDWFTDRCATHDGRGIGPNGENYPEAHGWLGWCNTCRWNPAQGES